MAKLEFPDSPTTGQQFNATNGVVYQWDGKKWQTRIVESYVNTGANPGLTPPQNPSPGTFWWDSEAGQLYIWYVDQDSSQWMQAAVLGTTYDSLGNQVTNQTLSSRNLPTGTYDLSLALEGKATYDGAEILDLPIALEMAQNLTVDQYGNQTIDDDD
tara:strand:+ start:35 stop:505 length:471 start_codon:yes stop_codon:yes gene_type:complete